MSDFSLRTLTWGTVTAAVASALWLSAGDSALPDSRSVLDSTLRALKALPSAPTAAGNIHPSASTAERARHQGQQPAQP